MTGHPCTLRASVEPWRFREPFEITGRVFREVELLHVSLSDGPHAGHGEGAGVYYLGETGESLLADVMRVQAAVENGAGRQELRSLLTSGGARNAIDCALWDLEAKRSGRTIWELTGIEPGSTRSAMTIGIADPGNMAEAAKRLATGLIKVKLNGDRPVDRIRAVCAARPDAQIIVDVNQGWTFGQLEEFAPVFSDLGVAMIEQPLPRGDDGQLEGWQPPVPLCADESCLGVSEFEQAARRYQLINIKLDKTGGLTEALELVELAMARGVGLMVGNMVGTSLAMAPGFVVAQYCRYVDLDGALFLTRDRDHAMAWERGVVSTPQPALWG